LEKDKQFQMTLRKLRTDENNTLRFSPQNRLRADPINAIIVSEGQLHEIMLLSQQYDFEREIENLNAEIKKREAEVNRLEKELRKQKEMEAAAAAAAAAAWHDAQQAQSQAAVDNFTARFSGPGGASLGSAQHRAVGSMYVIAQQARLLSGTPGYSPSIVQQTAIRFFP